ncbi:MAG: outer membrane beta-barrel protein [Agriterribacter sp.]
MKKLLFIVLTAVSISQTVKAQTGSVLVGGSIDFSSAKIPGTPTDTKSNSFSFSPTVGYQFNDNWTAGLVAGIGSSKTTYPNNTYKSSYFNAGPFIRYAKGISNMFAVYGQFQSTFGSGKTNGVKSSSANVTAFPALFINFKDSFGLNFTIGGIEYNSSKPSGDRATNQFNLTFGRSVGIGVSKNFGGRKK